MKILLTGGGTAGSVIPLLAIATELKKQKPETEFIFIGTKKGEPEKKILENYDIPLKSIYSGKFRRYFDLRNITDIFLIIAGFFQALQLILKYKPDVILGAGGYVQLPVIWAAWVLRKKILIHQQDVRPSLANVLTYNFANRITVTFEKSLARFPASKTVWTGNPVRPEILEGNKDRGYYLFNLKKGKQTILIVGGGTGAWSLNKIVYEALPQLLSFCQIIHSTGRGKGLDIKTWFPKADEKLQNLLSENYHQFEFIKEEMKDALAVADLVITRAGLAALTELSILGKPLIIIPLPESHQEENADYFEEKNAAAVIHQANLSPSILVNKIKYLSDNQDLSTKLSENIKKMIKQEAAENIVQEIFNIIKI